MSPTGIEPAQQQLPAVAESKIQDIFAKIENLTVMVTLSTSKHPVIPDRSMPVDDDQVVPMSEVKAPDSVTHDRPETKPGSVVSPLTVTPIVESREQEIRALLKQSPTMTAYEVAKQIGCSANTAKKWKERIELEQVNVQ